MKSFNSMNVLEKSITAYKYQIVSLFILFIVIIQAFHYGMGGLDFFEHSAVIRALADDLINPGHPFFSNNNPHAFYSPYAVILALISRIFHISHLYTMAFFSIFNIILLLIAIYYFCKAYFNNNNTSFYALILMTLWWGYRPWEWSGFYYLYNLPFIASYPSTFSMALSFLSLYIYTEYLKNNNKTILALLAIILMGEVVLLSHPITAIFLFTAIFCMTLSINLNKKSFITMILILSIILLLAIFWPYYNFFKLIVTSTYEKSNLEGYQSIFLRSFLAFCAIPIIFYRLRSNLRDFLGLMFFMLSFIYIFGFFAHKYVFGRTISFVIIILQLSLADWIAQNELKFKFNNKKVTFVALSGYLIVSILFIAFLIYFRYPKYSSNDLRKLAFLENYVSNKDVILSDIDTNPKISTYGARVIAVNNPQAFVTDQENRKKDLQVIYDIDGNIKDKLKIINSYNTKYILINRNKKIPDELYDFFKSIGNSVFMNKDFILIRIDTDRCKLSTYAPEKD
jgi:hypothetical protein